MQTKKRTVSRMIWAFLLTAITTVATNSQAQSNEVEALRQEYDKQMRIMQEAFEERIAALEEKVDTVAPKDEDFRAYWKDGVRFDSRDGAFKLKLGGRIQNDWSWWGLSDELKDAGFSSNSATEFRRARLYIGGTIYDNFEFKAQYDFADGDADFKDVYMAANNVPGVGQIKVGHFKEAFGLETLTSSKDTTFMERALPTIFAAERNTGIQIARSFHDDRIGAALGIFREADDFGMGEGDGYNFTGRLHGRPWLNEEGDKFVHLGAAVSHKNVDGSLRYRQRPENHMTDRYVDTLSFAADEALLVGAEAALVYGPASLQGEYMLSDVDATGMSDVQFDGFYLQASYFLTGEHRAYKAGNGIFDKISPNNNFKGFGKGGIGAWEVAARYSHLDLDDSDIRGGEESNITLGLNWYLNSNLKVMLNYIHGEIERDADSATPLPEYDGDFDALMTRFQVTW